MTPPKAGRRRASSHRPLARALVAAGLAPLVLAPGAALACACGCGVFSVGTSARFPSGSGGQAWIEYDYMDQSQNRSGTHRAPAADNGDKDIATDFLTLGGQYMFNRKWGVTVEVPYWRRTFLTTDEDTGAPATFSHAAFGDIRVTGMYAGFSPDMSTGVTFGLKLPSGDFKTPGFDRDTAIGTGSTDLLLGAYHVGALNRAGTLSYFVQATWDRPFAYQDQYRPGQEVDAAAGVVLASLDAGKVRVSPLAQVIASHRDRDAGAAADPPNSGYDRILASPGVEISGAGWSLYGDVELPVYERYRGDQLAAPVMFKVMLSRAF